MKLYRLLFLTFSVLFFARNSFADNNIENSKPKPIEVMILGTYHFSGSNLDIVKSQVESPLSQNRQKEISDLANRLAKFAPNKIALEAYEKSPNLTMAAYKQFKLEDLSKKTNERVQIGYRLAHMLNHNDVYGIDEESDTINYFPSDAVADYCKRHNLGTFDEIIKKYEVINKEFEHDQQNKTVREVLIDMNKPKTIEYENRFGYYGLLSVGDSEVQPGAELNAYWYMRNAKIFSKLIKIAKPGDRIIVIFGAGHAYWLRHFVQNTEGFKLIEPNKYLN